MTIINKTFARTFSRAGSATKVQARMIASLAAGTDLEIPLFYADFDMYIAAVWIINQVTVAADGTNYRIAQLRDKGTDGTGTTAASTAVDTSATALTAYDAISLSATSGYKLAAGKVLAVNFTHAGTGAALTNALIQVMFK